MVIPRPPNIFPLQKIIFNLFDGTILCMYWYIWYIYLIHPLLACFSWKKTSKQWVAKERIGMRTMPVVKTSLDFKAGSSLQGEAAVSEGSHQVSLSTGSRRSASLPGCLKPSHTASLLHQNKNYFHGGIMAKRLAWEEVSTEPPLLTFWDLNA